MKDNPFAKAVKEHKKSVDETEPTVAPLEASEPVTLPKEPIVAELERKCGRPATGKRSNDAWIGRTYYVKRETDLDVEDELLKLKRSGVDVDKSELVNLLLGAWVKWQQGENIEMRLSEITPRRKDGNKKPSSEGYSDIDEAVSLEINSALVAAG